MREKQAQRQQRSGFESATVLTTQEKELEATTTGYEQADYSDLLSPEVRAYLESKEAGTEVQPSESQEKTDGKQPGLLESSAATKAAEFYAGKVLFEIAVSGVIAAVPTIVVLGIAGGGLLLVYVVANQISNAATDSGIEGELIARLEGGADIFGDGAQLSGWIENETSSYLSSNFGFYDAALNYADVSNALIAINAYRLEQIGVTPVGGGIFSAETSAESEPAGPESAEPESTESEPAEEGAVKLPSNPGQTDHIFRDAPGHLPDTPENRDRLEDIANDPSAVLGPPDKHGNTWSARNRPDGSQEWVQSRNGVIINGGVNSPPRAYNPETGLSRSTPPQ